MGEYVFEQRKPTFVHTHEPWTGWSGLESVEALSRDYLPLPPVSYSPRIGLPENAPYPSERDFVRIDALSTAVAPGASALARAGAVEVLSASADAGNVTVLWRLTGPLPAGSQPEFVTHADGRPQAHPLLYGWVDPADLPVATVFRQHLPVVGESVARLTVVAGGRSAAVPLSR